MAVYKELGYLVRQIKDESCQIWPDAADVGIRIESYDHPLIIQTKSLMEGMGIPVKTTRHARGFIQSFTIDGDWPALLEAGFSGARISFVSGKSRSNPNLKGFLTVETWTTRAAIAKAIAYDN